MDREPWADRQGARDCEDGDEGQGVALGAAAAVAGPWAETVVGNCGCCCPSPEPGPLCSPSWTPLRVPLFQEACW